MGQSTRLPATPPSDVPTCRRRQTGDQGGGVSLGEAAAFSDPFLPPRQRRQPRDLGAKHVR
eukprot:1618672-Alexandrium_andersonii.AAC.1